MKFPFVRFGKCPVCGGDGSDDADASDADAAVDRSDAVTRESNADADDDVDISDGNGYPLYLYQGEIMCKMCIKEKKDDAEGERSADRHAGTQEFLAKAGFVKEVADA